uniref:Uncharacterized protein n=1 Tax=Arundo donax TaxID=35708 RepID=A0A0A9H7W2_ARUDO
MSRGVGILRGGS